MKFSKMMQSVTHFYEGINAHLSHFYEGIKDHALHFYEGR